MFLNEAYDIGSTVVGKAVVLHVAELSGGVRGGSAGAGAAAWAAKKPDRFFYRLSFDIQSLTWADAKPAAVSATHSPCSKHGPSSNTTALIASGSRQSGGRTGGVVAHVPRPSCECNRGCHRRGRRAGPHNMDYP